MQVDRACLLKVCIFGMGWGTAQIFLGLAVEPIGVALTFSIVLGMSAALGTSSQRSEAGYTVSA
jgi:L-rhamnose-H+ transport protein